MTLLTTDFSNSRAMIIDSSPMTRSILTSQFREFGFEKVTQCARLSEARDHFNESAFDVVLCEHNFGHEAPSGIDLVDELRSKQMLPMSTVVFMLTGEASYARVAEAAETGLDGYLLKPHKANQLHERLRLACYRKDSFREVFTAMEQKAFDVAADLCLERYQHRGLFWLYAARVGAELLMRTSRFQEAQELYEAIAEAKTAPWAKLGVARAMMESGNTVGAANALGALLEEDPSFADAYDVMARAQFELGNVAQARATYRMACEMTPDSVPRLQSLAMMSFYAGDTKEAGVLLDRATRIGLDSKLFDCQTLVVLAFTQLDANDHRGLQRSRDNFTRLLERNPGSARHQRGVTMIDAMLALLKNERTSLLALVRELGGITKNPEFDFEAASNLIGLMTRLAKRDVRVDQADARIETMAMRFCTSRPLTEMLAGAANGHVGYTDRIRSAGQQVQKIAQSAVTLGLMGDPAMAVRQLIIEGQTTLNSKLIEAAHQVLERYRGKISEANQMAEVVQALRQQFGSQARQGNSSVAAKRKIGGLKLQIDHI
jgi:DNA-binding response OmpR family regulator